MEEKWSNTRYYYYSQADIYGTHVLMSIMSCTYLVMHREKKVVIFVSKSK